MPAESKPRGELGEIRATLAALSSSGNKPEALLPKKDAFKKLISYSTASLSPSPARSQTPSPDSLSARAGGHRHEQPLHARAHLRHGPL